MKSKRLFISPASNHCSESFQKTSCSPSVKVLTETVNKTKRGSQASLEQMSDNFIRYVCVYTDGHIQERQNYKKFRVPSYFSNNFSLNHPMKFYMLVKLLWHLSSSNNIQQIFICGLQTALSELKIPSYTVLCIFSCEIRLKNKLRHTAWLCTDRIA